MYLYFFKKKKNHLNISNAKSPFYNIVSEAAVAAERIYNSPEVNW